MLWITRFMRNGCTRRSFYTMIIFKIVAMSSLNSFSRRFSGMNST